MQSSNVNGGGSSIKESKVSCYEVAEALLELLQHLSEAQQLLREADRH